MAGIFDVGTVCGEWTIRRYLDGSGQSEIYLADRTDFRGKIIHGAIRTIKFDVLQTDDDVKEVQRAFAVEYDALQKLSSEFIAASYDYGVMPHFWIATEYIEGESLAKRLRRGALTESEWVALAKDSIRGLMHAHDRKIVHQDVKPGNIMLRAKDGRAMWIDFGSASFIGKQDKGYNGSRQTLPYSAPERMDGRNMGDATTDMFSLGVMLYEAASGALPWRIPAGLSDQEQGQAVYGAKFRGEFDLSTIRPSHRKLISSLLNPDPKKRATAVQALQIIGTEADEIHGGTIYAGNVKPARRTPAQPRPNPNQNRVAGQPLATQKNQIPVKSISSPPEPPGNLKGLSLFLCWATFGILHPIVDFIWFSKYKSISFLRNGIIGTFLSATYLTLSITLPKVRDPDTSDMVIDPKYGFLVSAFVIGAWAFSFYSHSLRPRK